MSRDELERPLRISAAEVNASEDFLDILEVGLQHIEKLLPRTVPRKERFNRINVSRLQRIGAREVSVVARLGQIHQLDQAIGDLVHRRDDHGFSLTLLRAHDRGDISIAFSIGKTCAAKLMNHPWSSHGRSSRKVCGILDSM